MAQADSRFFDPGSSLYEAATAYESFLLFFPAHEYADYAMYMLGLSHLYSVNSADRDMALIGKAKIQFNNVIRLYPDSPYTNLSKSRLEECAKRLYEHELRVAEFYFKRKAYISSKQRLDRLAKKEDLYVLDDPAQVYFLLGQGSLLFKQKEEAERWFRLLLEKYPQSRYAEQAHVYVYGKERNQVFGDF